MLINIIKHLSVRSIKAFQLLSTIQHCFLWLEGGKTRQEEVQVVGSKEIGRGKKEKKKKRQECSYYKEDKKEEEEEEEQHMLQNRET